jgi:CRISPR/Cas system CSM-associated protein Csm3 (group 7 of RAMP superfamily)
MRVVKIQGRLTALSPIYHGGNEKTGNVVLLNRLRFIASGKPVDVPVISGNQIRGRLRRLLARDFLQLAGYELDLSQKKHQKLYHTLFAGGVLTEVEEGESGVVDLDLKAKLVRYVVPVRLFGASYANQMVEGRVLVGFALPICRELVDFTGVDSGVSFYQLITRAFQTRRDELRVGSGGEGEDDETVQMIVEYEVFAPGAQFFHELVLETEEGDLALDLSALYRAVRLWQEEPYIGGKSSAGFGRLKIEYLWPSGVSEQKYIEHVEENRDEIRKALDELAEAL